MVGTPSENGKKWIPRWWHTCVQWEKLPTRTLSLPWEAFPFLDLRSEGLSNLASLDQTSFLLLYDRGKWKFFPRHEKFVLICILSLDTCMSPWRNYYSFLSLLLPIRVCRLKYIFSRDMFFKIDISQCDQEHAQPQVIIEWCVSRLKWIMISNAYE